MKCEIDRKWQQSQKHHAYVCERNDTFSNRIIQYLRHTFNIQLVGHQFVTDILTYLKAF